MARGKKQQQSLLRSSTVKDGIKKLNMLIRDTKMEFKLKRGRVQVRDSKNKKLHDCKDLHEALVTTFPNGWSIFPLWVMWKHIAYENNGPMVIPFHREFHTCRLYTISKKCKKKSLRNKCIRLLRWADEEGKFYWGVVNESEVKVRRIYLLDWKTNKYPVVAYNKRRDGDAA